MSLANLVRQTLRQRPLKTAPRSIAGGLLKTSRHYGEEKRKTHFGYQTVDEDEKEDKVRAVFSNVADSYDLMNDAMSAGVHRLWKDHYIAKLGPRPGMKLLDVGGGTGDIAFRFAKYMQQNHARALMEAEGPIVTVFDINAEMLEVGKQRMSSMGISENIMEWVQGNAEALPFEDNTFDAYTIAFCIRNTTHPDQVVREAYRVLKPGGRLMVLEFSQVPYPALKQLYDLYSFNVIPEMGRLLADDRDSYQYLVESIRRFPDQETFAGIVREAGFKEVDYENLTFGVAAIHSGFKL
eukprot:Clim_evm31s197 gene=Clim_evmTU31s197